MKGPPLGPGGEDITWPDQVAPRGQKASSTRKIKPQTSTLVQKSGEVILCKPSLAHVSCPEITFSNKDQVGFVIGARATLPSVKVTFSSGHFKVDEELEKQWPVYCMMSLNERITAAQQLTGERPLTAHALQTHDDAKHDVDRMSEDAGRKRRSVGSVTMRSENSDGANGTEEEFPDPRNIGHPNIEALQSPTALAPPYSMLALHEMEPTTSAPEVGLVKARVSPYPAPKTTKEGKRKGFRPRSKGPKKDC